MLDFLVEREAYLRGQPREALIPLKHNDGSYGFWSDAYFGKLKAKLEKAAGIKFRLKQFRAGFAQDAKDRGVSIESVSKALRHKRTSTTEQYYARIRTDQAFAEIEAAYRR